MSTALLVLLHAQCRRGLSSRCGNVHTILQPLSLLFTMLPGYAVELSTWLLIGHMVQLSMLRLMHQVVAVCILPTFLLTPILIPSHLMVARWFTACTASVFAMSWVRIFILKRNNAEVVAKMRTGSFAQYIIHFCPLSQMASLHWRRHAFYRVSAAAMKLLLANAMFLEHLSCVRHELRSGPFSVPW